ncbi:unnamed protein product [Schistosoma margrebowiei]|uniref:Uncharacterized protein n=1 Tax=Schistosoma margrebowiei TaxID=48269 RepID=A0A183LC43_9TREM|nr:unnamed protein product [Schistosoma margrebowiei]
MQVKMNILQHILLPCSHEVVLLITLKPKLVNLNFPQLAITNIYDEEEVLRIKVLKQCIG